MPALVEFTDPTAHSYGFSEGSKKFRTLKGGRK